MTRIELSPQVFDDFDPLFVRLFDHIAQFDPPPTHSYAITARPASACERQRARAASLG